MSSGDKVQSAVDFLSDPNTQSGSLEDKVQFLRSKGLEQAEINQALAAANNNRRIFFSQPPRYELQRDWRDYFVSCRESLRATANNMPR